MQVEFGSAVESDTIGRFMSHALGWTVTVHTTGDLTSEGIFVDWNRSEMKIRRSDPGFPALQSFPWVDIDRIIIH
jgi:hypothetical protein